METALPEGFTIFELPKEVRKRLRTSNMLENLNKQIRRRTRVVSIFHNSASCLRLIAAVLMEQSDDWESGRAYLNPKSIVRLAMEQDIQAKNSKLSSCRRQCHKSAVP